MNGNLLASSIAIAIIITAAVLLMTHHELQLRRTMPVEKDILYDGELSTAQPLLSHVHGIQAQPTAVEKLATETQVVYRRGERSPAIPSKADVLLLSSTAVTAEEALGIKIDAGILRYSDRELRVPITPALRAIVLRHATNIRADDLSGPRLTRQDPTECRVCIHRSMCAIGKINAPVLHSS